MIDILHTDFYFILSKNLYIKIKHIGGGSKKDESQLYSHHFPNVTAETISKEPCFLICRNIEAKEKLYGNINAFVGVHIGLVLSIVIIS